MNFWNFLLGADITGDGDSEDEDLYERFQQEGSQEVSSWNSERHWKNWRQTKQESDTKIREAQLEQDFQPPQ